MLETGMTVPIPETENVANLTKEEQKKTGDKLKKDKIKKESNNNKSNKCC